jgi:hypothetical protein
MSAKTTSFSSGAARDLACVLAAGALFLGAAYVASGLVAAVTQNGYSTEMLDGLGQQPPAPVRLFRAVQLWLPRLALGLLLVGLLYVAARRVVRRIGFGESWTWDLLLSPVLGGLLAMAAVAVLLVAQRPAPEGWLASMGAYGGGVAAVLSALGFLAAGFARWRRLPVAIAGCVVVAFAGCAAADAWGSWRLAGFDREWAQDVAAERARIAGARRPVLRGEPSAQNAAPLYRGVLGAVSRRPPNEIDASLKALEKALQAGPQAALSPEASRAVGGLREDIAALRAATRSDRCDWNFRWGGPYWKDRPDWKVFRLVVDAVAVLGQERARAGDPQGAAEHYLDLTRFGSDYGSGEIFLWTMGMRSEEIGLKALGRLVSGADPRRPAPLDQIQHELGLLEGHLASAADGYRGERLTLGHFLALRFEESRGDANLATPAILPWLVPYRALVAQAVLATARIDQERARAVAAEDPAEGVKLANLVQTRYGRTWNPVLRGLLGYDSVFGGDVDPAEGARSSQDLATAYLRLAQGAVLVENERDPAGLYPRDSAGLKLGTDPFGWPRPLHYEATSGGRGYKLWSIGPDRKDDGGAPGDPGRLADVVVERAAR